MPKIDIPEGWKMTTLGEVAEINALTIKKDYHYNEIEYIDVASVEERKLLQTQKLQLKSAPSRARRIVQDNDILISTVRPNLKHFCFIKTSKPNLVASTGFAVVSAKRAAPYFLYNLLTTEKYTKYLTQIADTHTSTYPAFNPEVILNSKFLLPSLPEQHAIAAILSSFDDKIELLREQNKTLEAMAQAIYKRWFVDFEFPIEDETSKLLSLKRGEPEGRGGFDNILQLKGYKSSGGKMVKSELGEIPEGWRIGVLNDLCEKLESGGTPPTSNEEYWNGEINWFSTKELQDNFIFESKKKITKKGLENSSAKIYPKGSVVMAIYAAPTVGHLGLLGVDSTFNQAACGFIADDKVASNEFIYSFLLHSRNVFINLSNGAAQQNLNVGLVRNFKLIISNNETMKKFNVFSKPIFLKILNNFSQIQTLSALRDSLLPKLMSGKIRVPVKNEAETTLLDGDRHSSLTEEGLKSENPQTEGEQVRVICQN